MPPPFAVLPALAAQLKTLQVDAVSVRHPDLRNPQIAAVGLTEDEAREAGHDFAVKVQAYGDVAYGWAMVEPVGIVKLIADRTTGRILGSHVLGHEASILIQPLVQAMTFGLTVQDMARGQYWIHPALTEVVENALLGLED